MSQLVQFRQRIQAVETIKKITQAMRLIAMSGHARLKNREHYLNHFSQEIADLTHLIQHANTDVLTEKKHGQKKLYVIVTSQKGLCGNFNNSLLSFANTLQETLKNSDIISVGKSARNYCSEHKLSTIRIYEGLALSTLSVLSDQISKQIQKNWFSYDEVIFIRNKPVSFFVQKPEAVTLSISKQQKSSQEAQTRVEAYHWPIAPKEILQELHSVYIRISVETFLFQSLLAEQAARFQSMDSATRNAESLLETMKRHYNKLRQAKITKELIELSAGAQQLNS